MGGRYQAYPAYKDSGKDYYGNVPLHWSLEKIKYNSYVKGRQGWQNLRAEEYQDVGPYLVTGSHFDNEGGIDWDQCYRVSEERYNRDKDIWIKVNDVLMTKDGTIGKIAYIDDLPGQACLNSHLLIIRDFYQRYDQRFLYYLLGSSCFKGFIGERQTGTTFYGITQEAVEEFPLLICPVSEQQQIANFLDHETAKIDTLIEKQQQLIALLGEKRQAVVSHAVTKGLNPDAPMKDSGVEWLGEVAAHWEVKRVGYACRIDNNLRTPIDKQSRSEMEGEYPYYGPTGILNRINKYHVEGKYFLLGEDGDHFLKFRYQSMTIPVEGQFSVNNHAHLIKGQGKCTTDWACLYFEHNDLMPWLIKQGVGRYKLRKESLVDIPILVPPQHEQDFIINQIDKSKETFHRLSMKAESLIELLQEHRTALISAAVTGKIDVRNWQPPTDKDIQ